MKAPLTVIATGIDFADREIKKENGNLTEASDALNSIREETGRLGRMVSSMLNLASISDFGKNRERVDFAAFLKSSTDAYRGLAEQKRNSMNLTIPHGLPDVFVEVDRFTQVMANLISNAADHTQDGQITITASFDKSFITVCVADTGGGIKPELLSRVFERGISGRDGTGYGLYICKTVVETHGGTISIESKQGKGAAVTFTVPVYGGQEAGHRL
jgi:signal transduction histidine kinase